MKLEEAIEIVKDGEGPKKLRRRKNEKKIEWKQFPILTSVEVDKKTKKKS